MPNELIAQLVVGVALSLAIGCFVNALFAWMSPDAPPLDPSDDPW